MERSGRVKQLEETIAEVSASIDAATHRMLVALREFDELKGWHWAGAVSCAHWLSWRTGISLGPAREKVRVARALGKLPRVSAALAKGEVSYSQARAITRVADEGNEETLMRFARQMTTSQLEVTCRKFRQVTEGAVATPEEERRQRYVMVRPTDSGSVRIVIQVPADEAAVVMKAVDESAKRCREEGGEGARLDRVDGVLAMAKGVLAGDDRTGKPPVEVRLEVSALALADDGIGVVEGGRVSAETSRRLACDAGVVVMKLDKKGQPLDVGRKTRTISPALRRALEKRDGGCRFPGCTHTRFVDGHHVKHWAAGGETSLGNVVLLCGRHHKFVHEHGFGLRRVDDQFVFTSPDGTSLPDVVPRPVHARPLMEPGVSAASNRCGWDGVPMDYPAMVDALM